MLNECKWHPPGRQHAHSQELHGSDKICGWPQLLEANGDLWGVPCAVPCCEFLRIQCAFEAKSEIYRDQPAVIGVNISKLQKNNWSHINILFDPFKKSESPAIAPLRLTTSCAFLPSPVLPSCPWRVTWIWRVSGAMPRWRATVSSSPCHGRPRRCCGWNLAFQRRGNWDPCHWRSKESSASPWRHRRWDRMDGVWW